MRVERGPDGIYDFDALVVEPRLIRVGGETADVACIPLSTQMRLAKLGDRTRAEIAEAAENDPEGQLQSTLGLVASVTTLTNPKMDVEFLMGHIDMTKAMALINFVLMPAREVAEELTEEDEGNSGTESPSDSDDS